MKNFTALAVLILTLGYHHKPDSANSNSDAVGQLSVSSSMQPNSAMVKVKILGTAQDGGLPQLGCNKSHCQTAWENSKLKRRISALAICDYSNTKVYLVDATPDIREQIQLIQKDKDMHGRDSANPVDGILLTHAHMGHYSGLVHLGFESISTDRMPVYCTNRMADFLSNNGPWNQLINFENISLRQIQTDHKMQISPLVSVTALPVPHRDEFSDTVGFLITGPRKKLLYIPDIDHWHDWDRSVQEILAKVDYALLDGTFFSADELPNRDISKIKHPLITASVKLLQEFIETHPVKVYFTHLNHTNLLLDKSRENRRWLESKGFFVADDELEFEL